MPFDQLSLAWHDGHEGQVHQVKLHIDPNIVPVPQKNRHIPFHVRKQLEKQLYHDEKLGVIEKR